RVAASAMAPAITKHKHARRNRRLGEKNSKVRIERAKDSHTARVLVATIANGNAARKSNARTPRNRLRLNAFKAIKPSRFKVTPLATAWRNGPRARSAWYPKLSSRI